MSAPTTNPPKSKPSKKKRAPNWLPLKEEQLAVSWLNVSEKPEFAANQTGKSFFLKIKADFNTWSKVHYCSAKQIKTRWTGLNTITLKFSAIYNSIQRNPPRSSSPKNWMNATTSIYQDQSKGSAFTSVLAWQKLQFTAKWRGENQNAVNSAMGLTLGAPMSSTIGASPLSDTINEDVTISKFVTVVGFSNPTSQLAASLARPIGQKASKKRCLEGGSDSATKASLLTKVSQERLAAMKTSNNLSKEQNKMTCKRLGIVKQQLILEEQHGKSKLQMNNLKMLRQCKEDLEDNISKRVLKIMKKKIQAKWIVQMKPPSDFHPTTQSVVLIDILDMFFLIFLPLDDMYLKQLVSQSTCLPSIFSLN
ncbi:hypothetical protein PCANC_14091 [Puccinia coronata f. sp. avenae]|uniref:No apical meristem-associated C-terminal domain-containing protein n=1 Tax=Puccinia coronata f. sp. avenae TaxID=200324 RepID=A0A2N5VRS7_9BASI|nr:hypothetical protein PCASD_08337 [Puccinia coronata f. sp. avenae]PLW52672.1 hypothetical protein PCANC_14091 [Puccinia coronata f. sp. avenae]